MSTRVVIEAATKEFPVSTGGAGLGEALFGWRAPRRRIRAVDGVSFTLREGERLGIIGRNGAGKSTLLHLIAGLTPPSAGRVDVEGRVHAIMTLGAVLREEATGRENIYLDAAVQNPTGGVTAATIEKIIAFSELGEFIDRRVCTYSSGMKARLAFAMIAFIEPEILVIDEALSVGDAHFAAKADQRMKELSAAGRIVILVSHGVSSLTDLCSRLIWMDAGKIAMDGEPKKVAAAYQRAVAEADEAVLRRKFGRGAEVVGDAGRGALLGITLHQPGVGRGGAVLMPLEETLIEVRGRGTTELRHPDLRVSITRIDGVLLWRQRLPERAGGEPLRGDFRLALRLDKLPLGESIYRLDVELLDGAETVALRSAVLEVRDEEGQVGGRPMLFHPLRVDSRAAVAVPW